MHTLTNAYTENVSTINQSQRFLKDNMRKENIYPISIANIALPTRQGLLACEYVAN